MTTRHSPPQLRVITGGMAEERRIGGVSIQLAALEALAPALDAVVVEEDTFLVLGAEQTIREPAEDYAELQRELTEFIPPQPGSVLLRSGRQLELLAIVHDLERTPSWRREWIAAAIDQVLELAQQRRLKTLAMPLLGSVHGRFPAAQFIELLHDALERRRPAFPQTLWLAMPRAQIAAVLDLLEQDIQR